eukprot:GFYU01006262.1.p1 GENE.GFYU01006262.1~~GFYU01006262.1.p1  ORF type:complete len:467 (-),score=119.15 GFYU01006262.1:126-1526(-)
MEYAKSLAAEYERLRNLVEVDESGKPRLRKTMSRLRAMKKVASPMVVVEEADDTTQTRTQTEGVGGSDDEDLSHSSNDPFSGAVSPSGAQLTKQKTSVTFTDRLAKGDVISLSKTAPKSPLSPRKMQLKAVTVDTRWNEMNVDIVRSVGHVVVCGCIIGIEYFVRSLQPRRPDVPPTRIVILHPEQPDFSTLAVLSQFSNIYFVVGNPLLIEDLERAAVEDASTVVICCNPNGATDNQEHSIDADALLTLLSIEDTMQSDAFCIVELAHMPNAKFIRNKAPPGRNEDWYRFPAFAAGRIYSASMFDSLTCQTYFNPHIIGTLEVLLSAGSTAIYEESERSELPCIEQIPIPPEFIARTYMDLFEYLVFEHAMIPLGLYRSPAAPRGNNLCYVLTNPLPHTMLFEFDLIYVVRRYTKPVEGPWQRAVTKRVRPKDMKKKRKLKLHKKLRRRKKEDKTPEKARTVGKK